MQKNYTPWSVILSNPESSLKLSGIIENPSALPVRFTSSNHSSRFIGFAVLRISKTSLSMSLLSMINHWSSFNPYPLCHNAALQPQRLAVGCKSHGRFEFQCNFVQNKVRSGRIGTFIPTLCREMCRDSVFAATIVTHIPTFCLDSCRDNLIVS